MKTKLLMLVTLFAGLTAFAQDWKLQPTFGTHELAAGFLPDPKVVTVVPGGDLDLSKCAATIGMNVEGFVANAPDVDLNYTAGSSGLKVKVEGGAVDTILLINAPDGRWWYIDDADGLNPILHFPKPLSGNYNIWVGTRQRNPGRSQVRLLITEL